MHPPAHPEPHALAARLRRRAPIRAAVTAVVAVLALTGCVPGSDGGEPTPRTGVERADPAVIGSVPEELAPFYGQEVVWEPCEASFACASVEVPLDYADPGAGSITLAVIRSDATGQAQGTLLVNPGGPGASGVNIVRDGLTFITSERLRESFDIVGFDPRGVNRSSAVGCLTDAERDQDREKYIPAEATADQRYELYVADAREYAGLCAERSGALLGHVDTVSAARDLDILRALAGDPKLNFLGFSYGSKLGATYAGLFPERSGKLVLDGALDPSLTSAEVTLGQAAAFEKAIRAYVGFCQSEPDCPLPEGVGAGVSAIQDLFDSVESQPMTADDGRLVTIDVFLQGFILPLYDDGNWPLLTQAIDEALQGDPGTIQYLADLSAEREADGTYSSNSEDAFTAINCLDYPMATDRDQLQAEEERLVRASPTIGAYLAYGGVTCAAWKYPPVGEPAPIRAAGADPILVIGTTGDPATPYEWSVSLAGQLESAVHLTWEGEGHTAYGRAGECIGSIVDAYFVDGTVPDDGARC